jgi:hypothetical protein
MYERFYLASIGAASLGQHRLDRIKVANPVHKMMLHLWILVFLLPIVVLGDGENDSYLSPIVLGFLHTALLLIITPYSFHSRHTGGHSRTSFIPRTRRDVSSMFRELGPAYARRAYRMDTESFWVLHRMLRPYLKGRLRPPTSSRKKHRNGAKNGIIPSTLRLSIALRYFAGGSSYDICLAHGVSHSEVFKSVWLVVDAVNQCN